MSQERIESIRGLENERAVILRGTSVAVFSVQQHVQTLKSKVDETQKWAAGEMANQGQLLEAWPKTLAACNRISINASLGRCLRTWNEPLDAHAMKPEDSKLATCLDAETINAAARNVHEGLAGLQKANHRLLAESSDVEDRAQQLHQMTNNRNVRTTDEISRDLQHMSDEIEVLCKKMVADCDTIAGLPEDSKSISQASKTAHLHDNTFIPSLLQAVDEVVGLSSQITEFRLGVSQFSLGQLQQVSTLDSLIATAHRTLNSVSMSEVNVQALELLDNAIKLPIVFGSILIECVKRREWIQKMQLEPGLDLEERSSLKAEEIKRRHRWAEDMGSNVNVSLFDAITMGVEPDEPESQHDTYLHLSREHIEAFLAELQLAEGGGQGAKALKDLFRTLDRPLRRLPKGRTPTFKNGSLHEAMRGGSLVDHRSGDEDYRTLQRERTRAEDRLKSAESRVRKLEDLLHRQSHTPRTPSAPGFLTSGTPSFERQMTTPATNFSSALSKARESNLNGPPLHSRRTSFNTEPETKTLAKRIALLEAELQDQRSQTRELEKAVSAKADAEDVLKIQVQEAVSTKEDLLSNFEAQQHEFEEERRMIHDDNKTLKLRLEEVEDELDRLCESREHDHRIKHLEENLDSAREEAAQNLKEAQEQTELLRTQAHAERSRSRTLEQEIEILTQQKTLTQSSLDESLQKLRIRGQQANDYQQALLQSLLQISPDANAPEEFGVLVSALQSAIENLTSDHTKLENDHHTLRSQKTQVEGEAIEFKDKLHKVESKILSLEQELDDQKLSCQRLETLAKSVAGEKSTIESLYQTTEATAVGLRSQIDGKNDFIGDLQTRLNALQEKFRASEDNLEGKRSELASLQGSYVRLDSARKMQASKADEVSVRLFEQISKSRRLLEQLGFAVSNEENEMIVQRASRAASGSTLISDLAASMKRSISLPPLSVAEIETSIEREALHWAQSEASDTVNAFERFKTVISTFDTNAFIEAIYKRVKEVEHIARKSQRDARAYRDKSHRVQSEVHDRLALRSFKEGDLALFLPTREPATRPWAAFNVGAPYYFLREQDSHKLSNRDWLVARISKVEERTVDLSMPIDKSKNGLTPSNEKADDDNPYDLSDGVRWYLLDAAEEKPGAPINVGLGKTTVAAVNVDAKGTVRIRKSMDGDGATKTLTRSLDSRRSSSNSKKGLTPNNSFNHIATDGQVEQRSGHSPLGLTPSDPDHGVVKNEEQQTDHAEEGVEEVSLSQV